MRSLNSDHLELVIPSQFQKSKVCHTPSTQISEKKEFDLSISTNSPTLTIVTLNTGKNNPDSKEKTGVGDRGRRCMKKMTSKFLKQSAFGRNRPKKENVITKQQLDQRIMQSEQRKTFKKTEKQGHSIEYLQIKSLNLNEQLETLLKQRSHPKLKSQKRFSQISEKIEFTSGTVKNIDRSYSSKGKIKQQKAKQIVETSPPRSIQSKVLTPQKERREKKKTGFYDKLKERLSLQIKEIKQKQELNHTIGISSVKTKDFPGQQIDRQFRTALTQRSRPRTALTRVGLQASRNGNFVKKKRPQSSSAKVLEKRQIAYMNQKYQQETQRQLRGESRVITNRSTSRKRSRVDYNPSVNTTLKHVKQMHKRQNWSASKGELQRQKLKQKMLKILIECHGESIKKSTLDEGVEVFSRYCDKMNNNLSKTSRMITNVQRTVTIEEQMEQF